MPRTGSAACRWQGQVQVDVGRRPGVAVPGEGDRPPELVGHAGGVEHLVERDDLRDQRAELCGRPGTAHRRRPHRAPGAARSARRRASGGNRSGSGAWTEDRNAVTCATRPRRSMRASPGSWRSASSGNLLERTGHPAGGLDEPSRLGALVAGDGVRPCRDGPGGGGGGAYRLGVEGPARPPTGPVQHLVGEQGEVGQRAGPGALGGVDRLPDLEPSFGAGDHVRHTHYVTHYGARPVTSAVSTARSLRLGRRPGNRGCRVPVSPGYGVVPGPSPSAA